MIPVNYTVFVQTPSPEGAPPFRFGVKVKPEGAPEETLPVNSEAEFMAILALLQLPGPLFLEAGVLVKTG